MKALKLKAGALQMTLFVIVVIALLLGAFLLLTHLNKLVSTKTDFAIETVDNADKGIQYSLHHDLPYNQPFQVDLDDGTFKNLEVEKTIWGVFQRVNSSSKIKSFEFNKVALIGDALPKTDRTALYLENTNKPLVVVGNTKIKGDAYVSEKGIRPGNISGQSYYGDQLLYGNMKLSRSDLPKIDSHIVSNIKISTQQIADYSNYQFMDLDTTQSYSNSFFNPMNIAYSNKAIQLDNKKLSGHIIIKSDTEINVTSASTLKDIILIAPKISIEDHVKGNFQAIATDSIIVGENVTLTYPSALVLSPKNKSVENNKTSINQSSISIGRGSVIKGVVVNLANKTKNDFSAQIHIHETAGIYGEVYCTGNVELEGTVYGTIYTSGFVAHQNGSVYQNHIYNGNILANELSENYAGLILESDTKQIMQWLY